MNPFSSLPKSLFRALGLILSISACSWRDLNCWNKMGESLAESKCQSKAPDCENMAEFEALSFVLILSTSLDPGNMGFRWMMSYMSLNTVNIFNSSIHPYLSSLFTLFFCWYIWNASTSTITGPRKMSSYLRELWQDNPPSCALNSNKKSSYLGAASVTHCPLYSTGDICEARSKWRRELSVAPLKKTGPLCWIVNKGSGMRVNAIELGSGVISHTWALFDGAVASVLNLLILYSQTIINRDTPGAVADFWWLLEKLAWLGEIQYCHSSVLMNGYERTLRMFCGFTWWPQNC